MNAFAEIYASDAWTNGSGPGSHPAACRPLIQFLNRFLAENSIARIVDLGCGDWQFMSKIDLGDRAYVGFDVVDAVLAANRTRFSRPGVSFEHTPHDLSTLPAADLLVVKDVLIHLPNDYITSLTQYFYRYKYILAVNNRTSNPTEYNTSIPTGGYRPVDLARSPFKQDCATVLTYGRRRMLDPTLPAPLAFALQRFIWPGEKHVQLIFGARAEKGGGA